MQRAGRGCHPKRSSRGTGEIVRLSFLSRCTQKNITQGKVVSLRVYSVLGLCAAKRSRSSGLGGALLEVCSGPRLFAKQPVQEANDFGGFS